MKRNATVLSEAPMIVSETVAGSEAAEVAPAASRRLPRLEATKAQQAVAKSSPNGEAGAGTSAT